MMQNANFQVFQASAGSGKTYTIVKEYLKLCLGSTQQTENFRHILAITFTNAAANEMKAKIVNQLCEIIDNEDVGSVSMAVSLMEELGLDAMALKRNAKSLMTNILHDYSSFCVSTIDAFVQKISRTFAHDLGLPSQYSVSIDTEEVADTITENIGLQISDDDPFLVQLLMDFSENRFANQQSNNLEYQLVGFVEKLMSEKAYQRDENNRIENLSQYRQSLGFLTDKMRDFEREVKTQVEHFDVIRNRYNLEVEDFAYGKNGFVGYIEKLSKKNYETPSQRFRNVVETGKWYSSSAIKKFQKVDFEQIANEINSVLEPLLTYIDQHLAAFLFYGSQRELLYLYALRTKIKSEFGRLAQDEEVVHISEFNKLLNRVMGDFSVPFVYERIGEHFHHVFVDEFQDTSVMQWQNLLPLIDNGLAAGRMSMVVGDGKQSIYRFRSGEVEQIVQLPEIYALPHDERESAFKQYQRNLEDSFSFHNLDSNYRSFEEVVRFNNAFFAKAIKSLPESLQKVYLDENLTFGKKVSIFQQPQKKEKGLVQVELYNAESQPDYCLQRIEELVVGLTSEWKYALSDISVLVRNSKLGSEIANYLSDKGIPVISKDSILLKSSDKVQLLVNTLRYLLHPDNEVVVANVLYYRRMTAQPAFDGSLGHLFDSVKAIAQGTMPIEAALGLEKGGLIFGSLSKATCLYDLCCSLIRIYHLDNSHDTFLDYLMEEVFAFQNAQKEGIQDFLSYWDKKQNVLAVKSVSGNAVIITTIHKSKGLEYPVVIYPDAITDLDEKQKHTPAEEWIRPEDVDFEPIPNLEKVLFRLDKTAEAMGNKPLQMVESEKESNRLDNLNLLYVAFTRAKQRLYVLARQSNPDEENLIRDFLDDESTNINKVLKKEEGEDVVRYQYGDAAFSNSGDMASEGYSLDMADSSVSVDWFQKINIDPSPSMFWISPENKMQPREWGELVHQFLSEIQSVDDVDAAMQSYLLDGTIDTQTADMLKDKFIQMARHPMIGAAFSREAKVKNECEILSEHAILRPDRFAELPDVIYLIDYKTGKRDETHHIQLKNYIYALQGMVTKEIRAFLVYLSDSVEVERVIMDTLF